MANVMVRAAGGQRAARRLPFRLADVRPPELAALLRLAAPIAAVGLLNMGMSITDVVMVGWLGADALAAVAVMSDAYSIVFYLAAGVLAAVAPLIAEARGAGRRRDVRHAVRHGLWAAALVAGPAALGVWSIPALLGMAGMDEGLVADGAPYARIMAATAAAMMPVVLWRQVLSAHERPRVFMWFTAAALPLNALGNWLLMFGAFGLPEMGIAGAAASSLLVACAMAVGLTLYVALAPEFRAHAFFRRLWAVDPGRLRDILRIGLPIGISSLAEVGVFLTATIVVALFSAEAVAAHTITLRVAGIVYGPVVALGQAATVLTAHAAGASDHARLRRTVATALFAGTLLGWAYFAVLSASSGALPWLFLSPADADAPKAAAMAAGLMVMLGLTEIGQGTGAAVLGVLRGFKDTRVPMMLTVASQWIAGFGSGLVLAFGLGLGPLGVWAGLAIGTACATLATGARLLARMS